MDQLLFEEFTALRVEEQQDRLHVTLDRPAVRNAIDAIMVRSCTQCAATWSASQKF